MSKERQKSKIERQHDGTIRVPKHSYVGERGALAPWWSDHAVAASDAGYVEAGAEEERREVAAVLDPIKATWGIAILGALLILHCTVFWSPLDNLSRRLFGWSYNPPWTIWMRIFGVWLAVVGFVVTGIYWWINWPGRH
jgi:hypothetical protein